MSKLALVNAFIFLSLSLIHFYWAFGGQWALKDSVPYKEKGEKLLNPKKFDCAIVGLGLLLFSSFYLIVSGQVSYPLPEWVMKYGGWGISIIFILRAIGDFKYVGFTKKLKTTEFAAKDTQYYSPLCLMVGLLGVIIQLF